MELLCAQLGDPQRSFDSLHVVGTNGKSSVTAMAAALLTATGLHVGSCLSPHAFRWSERTRIDGAEIDRDRFAAATAEVSKAIVAVEGDLGDGERITQFEAAVAGSFVAFERAGIDVAVIEAGLGGRLDATNVIPSQATALTSVGLDHVEWLGGTELKIATEKLAVLKPATTLVIGALRPEVEALARNTARKCGSELVVAGALDPALLMAGAPPYLARNAGVAVELAAIVAGELEPATVKEVLGAASLPGRFEVIAGEPQLLADAAHNEQGARALAEALPALAAGRPVFACLSLLADKDATAIVAALAPVLAGGVCTAAQPGPAMGRPGARATEPQLLAELLGRAGIEAEVVVDPAAAVARTLELAASSVGLALCAGSHYLLRYAWTARHAQSYSR